MTKKDFQAIARMVYQSRQLVCDTTDHRDCAMAPLESLQAQMIQFLLEAKNPKFDVGRFIEACETGKCKGMKG